MQDCGFMRFLESDVRRAKRVNAVAFFVTVFIAVAVCAALLAEKAACTFSTEKWLNEPQKRTRIVSDLLERNDPTGMTLGEVSRLLGQADAEKRGGALLLRYPLGRDAVFVPRGNAVLEILFEGGVARRCRVTTQ